ncbi:MAG: glutamine-hydrolyzing GMP synthase [Candidatus Micrarchaeota archaeon]
MILIIDNGSQYTHLIKRKCRDFGFEAEMVRNNDRYQRIEDLLLRGVEKIVLSGGPSSVYNDPENLAKILAKKVLTGQLNIPLLGICYGHQTIAYMAGAKVDKGKSAEYGIGEITIEQEDTILADLPRTFNAWVSHYDEVKELPKGFIKLAHSDDCNIEGMCHEKLPIYSVQFHPEVWHSEYGEKILKNFLFDGDELGRI